MKKILKYICLACFLCVTFSCEEFLREEKTTGYTVDYIYGSPEGLKLALNAVYALHKTKFFVATNQHATMLVPYRRSDLVSGGSSGTGNFWVEWNPVYIVPTNAQGKELWDGCYAMISRCNEIIEFSQDMEPSDDLKKTVAEAECIRANAYLYLYQSFGRIWLNTKAITPENVDDEIVYKPATKAEVMKQLKTDLDDAISVLDWTNDPGRFNQAAARHLRMEVAMYEEDWAEALRQMQAIDASGKYSLVAIDKVFSGADRNTSENYLVEQWSRNLGGTCEPEKGYGHYFAGLFIANYWNQVTHKELTTTESRTSSVNGGYTYGRIIPNPYLLGLYDQQTDKRYNQWFIHRYMNTTEYDITYGKDVVHPGEYFPEKKSGKYIYQMMPGCTKYMDVETRANGEVRGYQDMIRMRMAESYIWAAEAALKSGDEATAKMYFNKTYMRAGNPEWTGTLTMDDIIKEHARELCFEGNRFFYIKRLGKAVEYISEHGGNPDLGANYVSCRANIASHPYFIDLPIPSEQVNVMGASFPQNEGY